jgi:hypothetical protein
MEHVEDGIQHVEGAVCHSQARHAAGTALDAAVAFRELGLDGKQYCHTHIPSKLYCHTHMGNVLPQWPTCKARGL